MKILAGDFPTDDQDQLVEMFGDIWLVQGELRELGYSDEESSTDDPSEDGESSDEACESSDEDCDEDYGVPYDYHPIPHHFRRMQAMAEQQSEMALGCLALSCLALVLLMI